MNTETDKLELCAILKIDATTYDAVRPVITALAEISKFVPEMDHYEKRMIFLTLRIMEQRIRKEQMTKDHEESIAVITKYRTNEN